MDGVLISRSFHPWSGPLIAILVLSGNLLTPTPAQAECCLTDWVHGPAYNTGWCLGGSGYCEWSEYDWLRSLVCYPNTNCVSGQISCSDPTLWCVDAWTRYVAVIGIAPECCPDPDEQCNGSKSCEESPCC